MAAITTIMHDAIRDFGGFTYDPVMGRMLSVGEDSGWCIAIPGTEYIIGDRITSEALADAVRAAQLTARMGDYGDRVMIGGWHSPERGFMIELTTLHNVSRTTAITIGELREQDAIFSLDTGEEITLTRIPVLS